MRVYHAGEFNPAVRLPSVLIAYEGRPDRLLSAVLHYHGDGVPILVDCGAYGAWKRGTTITLEPYIEACHAVACAVDSYAALDVIGDPNATARNLARMLEAGLSPIATVHHGTDIAELQRLLDDERVDYIGLGGLVGKSRQRRTAWLDPVWSALVHHRRWPIRVHGWGITDQALMKRYPWATVDGATAALQTRIPGVSRIGRVATAHRGNYFTHGHSRVETKIEEIELDADTATEVWERKGIVWPR